jgi:hypothetical protein
MLDDPWVLAFEGDGDLLVADNDNDRVRRISFGPGVVIGRVADQSAAPAVGVHVTLVADSPTWRVVSSTTTDTAGDYRFDGVDRAVVRCGSSTAPAVSGVAGAQIQVFTAQGYLAGGTAGVNGYCTLNALPPGDDTIRAIHPNRWAYHPTWSPGVAFKDDAVPLTVGPGATTADITFTTWT